MSEILGVAIVIAIIAFIVWLVGVVIAIALFVVIVIPFYVIVSIYAVVKFIALNIFVMLDTFFYLGFGIPAFVAWVFWGLVIGAAIQGYREMKIYGQKRLGVLIAITPALLLVLLGGFKIASERPIDIVTERSVDIEAGTKSESSEPPIPKGMVLIPAGEFEMGSSNGADDEKPVHTVYVDAFHIDKYEVTNAEYVTFLNTPGVRSYSFINPASHRIRYINQKFYVQPGYEDHPISGIPWQGAMAYAASVGKRLPTEAEWEKAARGGLVGKRFPWGDTIDASKANYDWNVEETTPVGKYSANGYGLYDMAGNVEEWCLDEYNENFYANSPYENPVPGGSIISIIDEPAAVKRVLRGGSLSDGEREVQCASRAIYSNFAGFRCVKPVPPAAVD